MAMIVLVTPEGQKDIDALPVTIKARVVEVIARLAQWPNVSGAKAKKHQWKGHYGIRTGDWRVLFRVVAPNVIIVRVQHRSHVYDD